jgi:hypothetical protein
MELACFAIFEVKSKNIHYNTVLHILYIVFFYIYRTIERSCRFKGFVFRSQFGSLKTSVSDPHPFYPDPDPT